MGRRSHSRSRSRSRDNKKDKYTSSKQQKDKEQESRDKEAKKRSKFSDLPVNESSGFGSKSTQSHLSNSASQQNLPSQFQSNINEGPTDIQSLIEKAQRNAQLNDAIKTVQDKPIDFPSSGQMISGDFLGGLSIPGLSINLNGVTAAKPATATQSIIRNIDIPQDDNFNYVGLILGPKGSNQKRIQEKTRCRIIIKADQIPPHVQIAGSTEKDVAEACCEIERILFSDEETRNKIKSEQLREVADINNTVQQNRLVVKVPQNFVGLILGKGGETIRSIKTQCGASYIQMDSNQVQGEDYKNFTVFGSQDQCEKAQKLIFDYIESYKSNSKKEIFEVPVELVGGFIGKNGCNIQNINKTSGAKLIMNNNNETVRGNKIFEIVGGQQQIQNALQMSQNLLDQLKQSNQGGQFNNQQHNYHNNNNHYNNAGGNHRDHYNNHRDMGERNYGHNYHGGNNERDNDRGRDYQPYQQQQQFQQQMPIQQQQMMMQDQQQLQHQYHQQMQLYYQQQQQQQMYYQYYQQQQQMNNPQIEEITIDQSKR